MEVQENNIYIKYMIFIKLIFFFILVIILLFLRNKERFNKSDPCKEKLTDQEYLEHMIPHHQVAVDISILLQKKTKNPKMQEILRKLIFIQNYEIHMMKEFLNKFPNKMSKISNTKYKALVSDLTLPNKLGLTKTYCDPHFFNPEEHMKHLQHMELNDKMYIEHMIPHHQVAVDMSKRLLKYTKNDFMLSLAYRIINSQQEEIILLNDLLNKNNYFYKSDKIL